MDEVLKLFGVMTAIMIPVALGGGVFVLISSYVRRDKTEQPDESGELERLRTRIEDLEGREAVIQQLEERLDFLERVLPALREGAPPLEAPRKRKTTPV